MICTAQILIGDVLDRLRELPDGSVHCCVTSPPYWGLRDYGVEGQIGLEATPELYVARMVQVFGEVRRVLHPSGTCWINLGDSYASGDRANYGSIDPASKQATHPAIKSTPRPGTPTGCKPKDLVGIPWLVAFALRADGWYLRSDIIWHKPNPMPESVTDRPTKAHEYLFLLSKNARYYYDAEAIKEPSIYAGDIKTGLGTTKEFDADIQRTLLRGERTVAENRNKRSVWTITTQPFSEAHFATFPEDLVEPCIEAGCQIDGTVLDPFCGSGTTLLVARKLGRNSIGIELNPEYAKMARKRIDAYAPLFIT